MKPSPSADVPNASDSKPDAKPDSKPGSKPDAKDDLKTLPLAEVEKKLARRRTVSRKPRRKSG